MADIDLVIPAHAKDFPVLEHAVRAALRHLSPVRNLYVVAGERFAARDPRVRWIPEPDLPALPSLAAVRERWEQEAPATSGRAAWVYQQLLKLGAPGYIEGLSPAYLVIDADVVFLRPVSFDPDALGRFPYSQAYEYHPPYRAAFARLFGAPPTAPLSLTVHHMLYDVALLTELRAELESRHQKPWYWAYVDAVDKAEGSSISEMDIYGWWVLERHPELARHRQLVWRDVRVVPGMLGRALAAGDVDFVAAHAWFRQSRRERYGPLPARLAAEAWARLRETARITR